MESIPEELESWDRFPLEIKQHVIKNLNFIERVQMRASSKKTRAEADSKKFNVAKLSVTKIPYGILIETEVHNDDKFKLMGEDDKVIGEQMCPLLMYLLKNANIEKVKWGRNMEILVPRLMTLDDSIQFNIHQFDLEKLTPQMVMIIQSCQPGCIQSFTTDNRFLEDEESIEDILECESMTKVTTWKIGNTLNEELPATLAKKWIEWDSAVGTSLTLSTKECCVMVHFGFKLRDRIINREENTIIIRTNNSAKNIRVEEKRENRRYKITMSVVQVNTGEN